MARLPRSDADHWPSREDPCPKRAAGLTHVQDGSVQCVFCGQAVSDRERTTKMRAVELNIEFTDVEIRRIEFLQWLYLHGRI